MKKYLIWICSLVAVCSCAVTTPHTHERSVEKTFADFRNFGIYISPDSCPDDYRPIGTFMITVTPARELVTRTNEGKGGKFNDGVYRKVYVNGAPVRVEEISYSNLVGIAASDAIEKGADGIANLKIEHIAETPATQEVYEITGLYIEKK